MNEAWSHHASCSRKVGAEADPQTVLDSNFRVRGTTNLRVVNASVFPYIPGLFIVTPILHDRGESERGHIKGCDASIDLK